MKKPEAIRKINVSEINPKDYHFFGLWKCNLLADWFWAKWLVPEYARKIKLDLNDGGVFVINGGYFFVKKEVVRTIRKYIKNIIARADSNRLEALKNLADEIYRDSMATAQALSKKEPIIENIRKMAETGQRIMFVWCLGYIMSEVIDEFLIPAAENCGIRREDIPSLIPSFETPLTDAQKNLYLIKKKLQDKGYWEIILKDSAQAITRIQKDKEIMELVKKHSVEYGWTAVINLVGEDPTLEYIIDQITHLPLSHGQKKNKKIERNLTFMIELASTIAYLRQTGVEYFSIYSRYAMKLFQSAANKMDVTYRELLDLNLNEIISGINGSSIKEIIKRRTGDKWAIYSMPNNEEPQIIDDLKILDRLARVMIPRAETSHDGMISGQVGSRGKAKGRVKVIISFEDFYKMESGDVLVTTMTTPDYVPLMQKSAAIITDIGGLLCHAAIISRELNKPCIIGTKIATKVLHDSDLVEVDADKGVVRILSEL